MAAEKNFENKIKEWLKSIGVYPFGQDTYKMTTTPCGYYEKRWGGGMTKSGLPDMHIVVNAISVDAEVKAVGGKPSEIQLYNLDLIQKSGGIGFVVIPTEGVEKIKKYISKHHPKYIHIKVIDFDQFKKLILFLKGYEPIGNDIVY